MFHDSRIPAEPTLSPARNTGGPGSKKKFLKVIYIHTHNIHTHKPIHIKQVLIKIHESGDTFTDSIEKLNHLPA